ncbi:MAG: glycosyltransferase [Bryobacteraceae bacterium]|jgi:glycosyltransferase involved in cell wall biosynthesis
MMRPRIGIYDLQLRDGAGGDKRCLVMAERLSRRFDVVLIYGEPCDVPSLASRAGASVDGVKTVQLRLPIQAGLRRLVQSAPGGLLKKAGLESALTRLHRAFEPTYYDQMRRLDLDLFLNNQFFSILPCPARRGIYMCMFPHRMRGRVETDPRDGAAQRMYEIGVNRLLGMTPRVLDSYQAITANSAFTAHWIERMWGRSADVVYSSGVPMGPPGVKEKIILHVGRFTAPRSLGYKHQHTLVEAFRRMTDLQAQGWQLHCAGNALPDRHSAEALASLLEVAAGLPVHVHANAPFPVLRDLYRRASIYWHATGYGSSEELHPDRQEHFGLTVVEAMSAGAVPVVLRSGGPKETIQDGVTGYLWDSLDDLARITRRLAADPEVLRSCREQCVPWSAQFSSSAFADRVDRIVDRVLNL